MLTKVEVYTAQGETLALPLHDPSGGYVVKEIEGLDPVKAEIVSSPFAQRDGTQYQASRRDNRNVVLKLGLEPDYVSTSVLELRRGLYRYLMPKTQVTLRFYIDGVHFVDISGRVESLGAPLFSREPEAVISLLCFDPDFSAVSSIVVPGATVADTTEMTIAYPGSVETGILFEMTLDRDLSEFTIYNQPVGGEYQALEFAGPLLANDTLTISTVSGAKRATLTRFGTPSSILYGVSPLSTWINLYPGDNQLRVAAEGAPISFTIEYLAKYGGL